jgi:hypothetical protein
MNGADKPKAFDSFEAAMRELARRREAEVRKAQQPPAGREVSEPPRPRHNLTAP